MSALRIVVLGYMVRGPFGGVAWHHLQYVLGLRALGHDVWFLEDSDDYESCYDPDQNITSADPGYGLRFTASAFARIGLGDRWAYHDAHTGTWHGGAATRIRDVLASADLLINTSGVNPLRPWLEPIPVRAFIDTDPAFKQVQHLQEPESMALARGHNVFFTFGEGIARGTSSAPPDGLPWQATRQPIVLDAWPVTPGPRGGRFTTLMQWESYKRREHDGIVYGLKADAFPEYFGLAARTRERFHLLIGGSQAPRDRLRELGFGIVEPEEHLDATRDPWSYQRFIQGSKGEWSIAKQGYVDSACGWFSDRNAGYLACGRPVLAQDTGFTGWLPAGEGILAFRTPDEALAGLEEIDRRYDHHCRQARAVIAEYFDARKVLASLVERAMAAAPSL